MWTIYLITRLSGIIIFLRVLGGADCYIYNNGDVNILLYGDSYMELNIKDKNRRGNCIISSMPIRYVHELQHALRLCGIDNKIELK